MLLCPWKFLSNFFHSPWPMCHFQGKQARWSGGWGGWRVECCHGNKGFQRWVSMVIVAKFWEALNALFKIHNNCAAAEDVVRGREEWTVCSFMDPCLVWFRRKKKQGSLRTDVLPVRCCLAALKVCSPSNTGCSHSSGSQFYLGRLLDRVTPEISSSRSQFPSCSFLGHPAHITASEQKHPAPWAELRALKGWTPVEAQNEGWGLWSRD